MTLNDIPTPAYVLEEHLLRQNLSLIRYVADEAGVEIIMAFKAFALWKSFPIVREYISGCTASSLSEAEMGNTYMQTLTHTYAPVYKPTEFGALMERSSHITFNSLSQFERFYPEVKSYNGHDISCGLRINPEYGEVETDLYNPASPASRLGVPVSKLPPRLPEGIEGLHFHTLCENDSHTLERTLAVVEERFGKYLDQVKWLNMGGGHLMTSKDYDTGHLIALLRVFRERHPNLRIIMEPGAAFVWQTGVLVTEILDIVENGGISTLMMDASFTCHMPDTLEMPYQPRIRNAKSTPEAAYTHGYRVGGNSCLSGDFIGDWFFKEEEQIGDRLIFEDMIHYTTVKTTMFNGVTHPSIWMHCTDDSWVCFREYTPKDYLDRMC